MFWAFYHRRTCPSDLLLSGSVKTVCILLVLQYVVRREGEREEKKHALLWTLETEKMSGRVRRTKGLQRKRDGRCKGTQTEKGGDRNSYRFCFGQILTEQS